MDTVEEKRSIMKLTVNDVRAGDTVRYHGFSGTVDYLIIKKETSEFYRDSNGDVTVRGTLTGRSVDGKKTYNNFFCIADGTFPNLTLA